MTLEQLRYRAKKQGLAIRQLEGRYRLLDVRRNCLLVNPFIPVDDPDALEQLAEWINPSTPDDDE